MMKTLSSAILPFILVSCSLEPLQTTSDVDDAPVRINKSAIPVEGADSALIDNNSTQTTKTDLKSKGKLGFRTPDLVKSLPSETQTTGSAPQTNTIDEKVNSSTTIRATDD